MREQTVTINGKVYDKRTGMPVRAERVVHNATSQTAQRVHQQPQKSRTLNRKYVKQDAPAAASAQRQPAQPAIVPRRTVQTPQVSRSESISRFAKEYNAAHAAPRKAMNDIAAPTTHPIARKAHVAMAAKAPAQTTIKPSAVIKQEAIANAMAKTPAKHEIREVRHKHTSKARRQLSMASASLAILLLGGYFTYLNMPQISTRVAAAQAGIAASYPTYHPTGYSLSGPVAYDEGSVSMKFAANASPQNFTLSQSRSGWDSSAVLDNYVTPKVGDNYSATTMNGLTIYTYGTNAVWVNGGILYSISGNAPLSSDQIGRIAISL